MNYIRTERFVLNPHNGSGTLIVIPELKRKFEKKPHVKWEGQILTTEPIEYYRKKVKTTTRKSKKKKKEKKEFHSLNQEWSGIVPNYIKNKPWLIKPPSTILDNYITFEPL